MNEYEYDNLNTGSSGVIPDDIARILQGLGPVMSALVWIDEHGEEAYNELTVAEKEAMFGFK